MSKKITIKNRFDDSVSEMSLEERPFGVSVSITEKSYEADDLPLNYAMFSLNKKQLKAIAEFYMSIITK